jgi:16S rRNA (cytosine967-C5)-methyltransferase
VGTSVALARSRGLVPFAGLVNAVLRRLSEAGSAALEGLDGPRLDTPSWLWTAWGAEARAIAEAHQHEAPLDLTCRPGAAPPEVVHEGIAQKPGAQEGAAQQPVAQEARGIALPTGSWRYPPGTRVADLPGYAEGLFWVQDAAAALPARLLGAGMGAGARVADLCAAPGGKAAQLAAAGARVVAVERDAGRLARLRENFARLRLEATFVQADAAGWAPSARFDAVLLDAPCSSTGTIRRHPDVPYLKRPQDIAALAAQQDQLLDAACALLQPGGRLVYAVCSLQPEEGAARVAAALARLPLTREAVRPEEVAGLESAITPAGDLRTTPAMWADRGGLDGFFVARLRRR